MFVYVHYVDCMSYRIYVCVFSGDNRYIVCNILISLKYIYIEDIRGRACGEAVEGARINIGKTKIVRFTVHFDECHSRSTTIVGDARIFRLRYQTISSLIVDYSANWSTFDSIVTRQFEEVALTSKCYTALFFFLR